MAHHSEMMIWTLLRFPGLCLASPNSHRGLTRWAAIRHTAEVRLIRSTIRQGVESACLLPRGVPSQVELVRVAPRRYDSDNLVSAFKPARDGLCEALGFDDRLLGIAGLPEGPRGGQAPVRCLFGQRSAGARVYAVELRLEWADPA